MSCMSQNFRLFLVSNLSVQNFWIFLLMYPGSLCRRCTDEVGDPGEFYGFVASQCGGIGGCRQIICLRRLLRRLECVHAKDGGGGVSHRPRRQRGEENVWCARQLTECLNRDRVTHWEDVGKLRPFPVFRYSFLGTYVAHFTVLRCKNTKNLGVLTFLLP